MESDLRHISPNNLIFKFANDTNLLVSEQSDNTLQKKFANILDWARLNKRVVDFFRNKILFSIGHTQMNSHFFLPLVT